MSTPRILENAYSNRTYSTGERRRLEHVARGFRVQPEMERVIQLQQADPAAYRSLGLNVRLSAAMYAGQKAAAETLAK